jgi:hypothetical protein
VNLIYYSNPRGYSPLFTLYTPPLQISLHTDHMGDDLGLVSWFSLLDNHLNITRFSLSHIFALSNATSVRPAPKPPTPESFEKRIP